MVLRGGFVGLALLALLGVIAIGSRSEGWRGGGAREVSPRAIDFAYTLAILVGIGIVIVIVLTVRGAKGKVSLERPSGMRQVVLLMAFLTFIGAYGITRYEFGPRQDEEADDVFGPPTTVEDAGDVRTPARPRNPQFQWWLAVLTAGGATAAVILWRRRRRPDPWTFTPPDAVADELSEVLTETLDDLSREHDPRRAVIRAYARMERILGDHGLPRAPHETPLEYLARVLRELNVRAESAHALTELFERAKFSQHEIDLAMKEEAIAALARVRDDLDAAA